MCRKVQVARPRDSTSGGQWAGLAVVVDDDAASAAVAVAVEEEAMGCAAESLLSPLLPRLVVVVVVVVEVLPAVGGFQFRKVVQILQGLPSGPRIVPGGSWRALEEEGEGDCAVNVSFLLDIVEPRELQMGKGTVGEE